MSGKMRRVYLLRARDLAPETIAVAFAKTSRSPESFDRTAAELSDSRSAEFHQKWVVGYGHSSIAEHAVLHIAAENVSRLAIECIESNRLASFTEKSTRYQKWSSEAFVVPPEIAGSPAEAPFRETCGRLLDAYQRSLQAVGDQIRARHPRQAGESEARWEGRIRSSYADICRYLLPAASLANVGITINARALEHALRKMLSHPLREVRAIGSEIRQAALEEVPTLVKYAEENAYLRDTPERYRRASAGLETPTAEAESPPRGWMKLVHGEADSEDRVLAAAGVRFCGWAYEESLARIRRAPPEEKRALGEALLELLGDHDSPVRELEYVQYVFEAVMDQGAYFEVKRHRIASQTPSPLTCRLGYVIPRGFQTAGFLAEYQQAMSQAAGAYENLRRDFGPEVAAYAVPNGFLRRLVLGMNLREAFHFCALRSSDHAHAAVRVLALQAAEQIQALHPILAGRMQTNALRDWIGLEQEFFLTDG
ncbi:MAG: FAD-dependent thymidylate synthase [Anaerolineales bacterium]|nr:FAD-dependent thymidylate synthase [Anaerolineales bacterium]